MEKIIVTQEKNIVNCSNLLAIFIDEDSDETTGRLLGFDIVGIQNLKDGSIVLGSFDSENSAKEAMSDLLIWLKSSELTFEMPIEGGEF